LRKFCLFFLYFRNPKICHFLFTYEISNHIYF
jgi:hypothetical protein